MMPDRPAPRVPQRQREIHSLTPGKTARSPEPFQCRLGGRGRLPARGKRRSEPVVTVRREIVIGGVLLAAAFVVAGGLWWTSRTRDRPDKTGGIARTSVERPKSVAPTAIVWEGPIPSEVADHFTRATSHAQRLRWVRHAEAVGPAMEAFFREGPGSREKIVATRPKTENRSSDMLYEVYEVEMEGGGERFLCVSVDPEGAKVDFKAYARYGSESWEDLLSGEVKSAEEVRVVLKPDGYYHHHFADEGAWGHFKATTPDLPQSLDFYVARDSPAARDLNRAGAVTDHLTLAIRSVDDSAKSGQFEITAVKAAGWVEPDE
jgi:hypothetical protein